jgi:chemosensory pili system protein ChpB (putative protein-glutamate methylesterase)
MPQQTNSANSFPALPSVGLIADSDLHRHILKHLLQDKNYSVLVSLNSKQLEPYFSQSRYQEPDLWLVDAEKIEPDAIDLLLKHSEAPLLTNDAIPQSTDYVTFENWQERLLEKLKIMALPEVDKAVEPFEMIWVLAASLGGPDAVDRFLSELAVGLPIAMVYAQHTEIKGDQMLASTLGRGSDYVLALASEKDLLSAGKVTIVPVDRKIQFLENDRILPAENRWEGDYQPAIDQVIAELARLYRERLGVIVFSGMCNDGEAGCRVARACGATVWAQTPESCVSDEMPQAVIDTGFASKQGTPEQLAAALNRLMARSAMKENEL